MTPLSGPTVSARFIERTVAVCEQVQLAATAATTMGWVSVWVGVRWMVGVSCCRAVWGLGAVLFAVYVGGSWWGLVHPAAPGSESVVRARGPCVPNVL